MSDMPKEIEKYYKAWLARPKLFGPHDDHFFYLFVKAVVEFSEKPLGGQWLREYLQGEGNIDDLLTEKACRLFETLQEYDKAIQSFGTPTEFDPQ